MTERCLVKPVRVISQENWSRLTPAEHEEMCQISLQCTENNRLDSGSRMFKNMLRIMDSRQWAMADRTCYGFDMGPGPDYPINCYRQSFMGWFLPES